MFFPRRPALGYRATARRYEYDATSRIFGSFSSGFLYNCVGSRNAKISHLSRVPSSNSAHLDAISRLSHPRIVRTCPHAAETDHLDMRESATHRGETRDALGIRASWCPRAAPASHHHHKARCRLSLLTLSPARHAHTHTRHSTPHHTFHSHAHNAVQRRIGRVGAAAPGGEVGIRRRSRAPTPHSHAPCPRGHTYTNGSNGGGAERRRRHRRSSAPSPAAHRRRRAAAARQRR